MHFRIAHEIEISRDAVELAVVSPDLIERLQSKLPKTMRALQKRHALEDGVLERVWTFEASIEIPKFASGYVGPEVAWDQHTTYTLAKHEAIWSIVPEVRPQWRKYFTASGTYSLRSIGEAKTERVVEGDVELHLPMVKKVAERMILALVKRAFVAEAETLRDMATLV